jgi:DNA polymerase-3 subunit alpha
MAGLPDAYWAAVELKKKTGKKVKFLAGCEIYLNDYHQEFMALKNDKNFKLNAFKEVDPDKAERFRRNRHLVIICKDMTGYKNLITLQRKGFEQGLYGKYPRVWTSLLEKHKEGLIVISGCLNGPICHELRKGAECRERGDKEGHAAYYKKALKYVQDYREKFGENFYIELQMPGEQIERGKEVFFQLSSIAKKLKIPAVMTGDIHYLHRSDFELQTAMMAIGQNTTIDDPGLFHVDSDEGFFKTRAQFRQTFVENGYAKEDGIAWFEKVCDQTMEIAERCKPFSPDLSPKLPEIADADEKLKKTVAEALRTKGLHLDNNKYLCDGRMVTYKEQVKIELQRIMEKKFSSYFLITRNLVMHARDNRWDVGPARGSAGGSLTCYLLGIHDMDPLKWGLSFDRFLSPSRGGFMLEAKMAEWKEVTK